jgi:hypothetical protein
MSHARINQLLGTGGDSTVLGAANVTFQVRNCNNVTGCGPWESNNVRDFHPAKCYPGYVGQSPSDLAFAPGQPQAFLQVLSGQPVITLGSSACNTQSSSLANSGPMGLPSLYCITDAATCGYVALRYQDGFNHPQQNFPKLTGVVTDQCLAFVAQTTLPTNAGHQDVALLITLSDFSGAKQHPSSNVEAGKPAKIQIS